MTNVALAPVPRQRFTWVVASEWTKLRTLRSNKVALALTFIGTVGIAALICAETAAHWSRMDPVSKMNTDPTALTLNGWYLAQLIVGVVAVLAVTSEYGSGMIRSTFTATARRRHVLAAKAVVVTVLALLVGIACSVVSFFVGQALLRSTGVQTTFGAPGVARSVIGGGLYAGAIALLGLGLGAIIRNTAGSVSALFGVLFVPPIIAEAFPSSWHDAIQRYAPLNAGSQLLNVTRPQDALGPWAGYVVMLVYVALAVMAAFTLIGARDS